jgi:peptidoglycan lytic transglycosylase
VAHLECVILTRLRAGYRSRVKRIALLVLVVSTSCALWRPPAPRPVRTGPAQTGTASWYGGKFHGRRTASGERFDQSRLTAASRSLPLGSRARVTNLENGRSVEVEITDRGPFARGRVLDVSQAAARALGMVEDGTARVRIEPMAVPREARADPR